MSSQEINAAGVVRQAMNSNLADHDIQRAMTNRKDYSIGCVNLKKKAKQHAKQKKKKQDLAGEDSKPSARRASNKELANRIKAMPFHKRVVSQPDLRVPYTQRALEAAKDFSFCHDDRARHGDGGLESARGGIKPYKSVRQLLPQSSSGSASQEQSLQKKAQMVE